MPTGRPTTLTDELALAICELISTGHSLRQIEKIEGMPAKNVILRWVVRVEEPYRSFGAQYARACDVRAELWAEEVVDIADDGSNDWYERENKDGSTERVLDHENINRSRVRIDTRKWLLSKVLPKKYGDKLDVKHEGGIIVNINRKPQEDDGNGS